MAFFLPPPPNFTKVEAHYKFLDLENLGRRPVQFIQGLGLSQIRGGQKKSHPVDGQIIYNFFVAINLIFPIAGDMFVNF